MSALLDDHGALTTIFIPAAVQAAVMTIELGTGAAEVMVAVVTMHIPVAANADAE